jgi:hypothetical protein
LIPLVMFPVLVAAAITEPTGMFKKIISKHGTYLESTDPMPCGADELDAEKQELVSTWFARVAGWPNFRHMYPMGQWDTSVESCRVPREAKECLYFLNAAGVPHEILDPQEGLMVPVKITGAVDGVSFTQTQDLVMECEMAATLPALAAILARHDIVEVGILSSFRPDSTYSFHSVGLALDINWLRSTRYMRSMWLKTDYQEFPEEYTCSSQPTTPMAKTLQAVACDMWDARIYNTVLTPNYNEGHDNHFHIDLRPGDNRYYIR